MKTRYRRQPLAAATTLFLMALAMPAAAQSVWTGAIDDDWFKAGNWQDGVVPPNGINPVLINTSAPAPVIDGNPVAVTSGILVADAAGSNASLTIRNSGTLNTAVEFSIIAGGEGSTGTVTIDGAGSTWANTADLFIGGFGDGTLNTFGGGTVESGNATIASDIGSTGLVTVDGDGSTWSTLSSLTVGARGSGRLDIRNGGTVKNGSGFIALSPGSTGLLTVDGAGSTWSNDNSISVGFRSKGTLDVRNGGRVESAFASIGLMRGDGAFGLVTVDGAGSIWINKFVLGIGVEGNGTLNILNGGIVQSSDKNTIADLPESMGLVTVDGAGSKWLASNRIDVGNRGNGTLNIFNSGEVRSFFSDIAREAKSTGLLRVDGVGSTFSVSDFIIGNRGNGELSIINGGKVDSHLVFIAEESTGLGLVTVDGAGSTWTLSSELTVGAGGQRHAQHFQRRQGCVSI